MVLSKCFFLDALSTVFSFRTIPWARASVEQLFQLAYRHRHLFTASEAQQIAVWQAELKASTGPSGASVSALSIGEAAVPVKDAREERILTDHGSVTWSRKQCGC